MVCHIYFLLYVLKNVSTTLVVLSTDLIHCLSFLTKFIDLNGSVNCITMVVIISISHLKLDLSKSTLIT